MAKKKQDRARAIEKLLDELAELMDGHFGADTVYDLVNGLQIEGHLINDIGVLAWPEKFQQACGGELNEQKFKKRVTTEDGHVEGDIMPHIWDIQRAYLITGFLFGQARAGVPMAEIKRQARAMLERS